MYIKNYNFHYILYKLYCLYLIVEGICNAAGFGYNGTDENGTSIWNITQSIDVFNFEFGTNIREQTIAWNMSTANWIRRSVFKISLLYYLQCFFQRGKRGFEWLFLLEFLQHVLYICKISFALPYLQLNYTPITCLHTYMYM